MLRHCWRSTPVLWGGVLLWVVLSTACRATRDDASARLHEKITVYTSLLKEETNDYLVSFKEKHPDIQFEVEHFTTERLWRQLYQERDNPKADVIWGVAVTNLILAEWYDMLVLYAPDGLAYPDGRARVRPKFRDSHTPPHWVGITAWTSVFCVNTEWFKKFEMEPPTTWDDLQKPDYKGQLMMPNPLTGTGYMVLDTILQHYGQTEGWEYLAALQQNGIKYHSTSEGPCEQAGAGEIAIGISHDLAGNVQKKNGKPIKVIFPWEGVAWDMEGNALVKKVGIKPAAKIFLDWAISDPAMQAYGLKYTETAVKSNPAQKLFDRDFVWGAAHRNSVFRQWQQLRKKVAQN